MITTIMADIYLLSRVFKEFDISNISKDAYMRALPEDQPQKPSNIIIYVGDEHAQRYRRFLKSPMCHFIDVGRAGTPKPDITYDDKGVPTSYKVRTCINMKTIPQPFFTKDSKVPRNTSDDEDEDIDEYEHDDNFKILPNLMKSEMNFEEVLSKTIDIVNIHTTDMDT